MGCDEPREPRKKAQPTCRACWPHGRRQDHDRRRLAERLGWPFYDSDHEVEIAAGRTVSEIFSDFGEAAFRDGERRVIARLIERSGQSVIALGGGAFINDATRALIRAHALSVWLKVDIETLMERVLRRDTRPLLQTGDPRAVMERLLAERSPVYAEADIHVTSPGPRMMRG